MTASAKASIFSAPLHFLKHTVLPVIKHTVLPVIKHTVLPAASKMTGIKVSSSAGQAFTHPTTKNVTGSMAAVAGYGFTVVSRAMSPPSSRGGFAVKWLASKGKRPIALRNSPGLTFGKHGAVQTHTVVLYNTRTKKATAYRIRLTANQSLVSVPGVGAYIQTRHCIVAHCTTRQTVLVATRDTMLIASLGLGAAGAVGGVAAAGDAAAISGTGGGDRR